MADDFVEQLRNGLVGFFSATLPAPVDTDDAPERGHVRLDEAGVMRVVTLNEDIAMTPRSESGQPTHLAGITEAGGVLLLGVPGRSETLSFGSRASVFRYAAATALLGIPVDEITTPRLREAGALFHGVGSWAGVKTSNEDPTKDSHGRLTSYSVTLKSPPPQVAKMGSLVLTLTTDWRVSGPEDNRRLEAPIALSVSAGSPRSPEILLEPLRRVQELMSLAFQGLVVASGGRCVPTASRDIRGLLWDRLLMTTARQADAPGSMTEIPLFYLSDLGGVDGLARFVRLSTMHWRAVRPTIAAPARLGPQTWEARLLESAAATEYWVNCHRRTTKWARVRDCPPLVVAGQVGEAFADWVGDPQVWAERVWDANNHMKHNPARTDAPIDLLAETTRYLVVAALLNRVAGSRTPGRRIFNSHRLRALGRLTRIELGVDE